MDDREINPPTFSQGIEPLILAAKPQDVLEGGGIKIQKLKDYFEKRDDVVMAFLFGSQAEERAHQESDWDIAVYFKPEMARVEWEELGREYPEEDHVWSSCADIVETEHLDLIVLNRAPATIADSAIHGEPLVIKDRKLFLDFMLIITRAAEDFRAYVKDYYEIYERSHSLSDRDAERLRTIILFLEEQISHYKDFASLTEEEYMDNFMKRGAVERWVENIMNAAVDISKIILASEKRLIPRAYRESMKQALRNLHMPEEYTDKFDMWVKIRNEFAHEYLDIKWKKISVFIRESERSITQYAEAVKQFLETKKEHQ